MPFPVWWNVLLPPCHFPGEWQKNDKRFGCYRYISYICNIDIPIAFIMKRLQLLLMLVFLAIGAWAQQITEQQAMDRALQFLNTNKAAKARGLDGKQLKLEAAEVEANSIYAFNLEGGGYVIASGDSRALPVLGYSDKGTIDWKQIPSNMRAWLKSYDQAMATLGHHKDFKDGIAQHMKAKTRATKSAVAPLLKTTWDQAQPYWDKTPPYEGANPNWQNELVYTGCVATALAQVMNYHQWPQAACTEIPAYDLATEYEGVQKIWHIDGLPSTTFDWDQMLDTYWEYDPVTNSNELVGTEAQQDAVATLMRYCGQAVRMMYSPEGSGSFTQYDVDALVKYFGYDKSVRCVKPIQYGIDAWEDLIYGELADGRPVLYSGISQDMGGHAFVCDGYDGSGLFHINWGWGGSGDGYFSLAVLDPYVYSNQTYYNGVGYNIDQDAIINVKPASDSSQPEQVSPTVIIDSWDPIGVFAADSAYFRYSCFSLEYDEILVDYAFGTCDADGSLTPVFMGDPTNSIVYIDNYHQVKIDPTAYQPGEYQVLYPMVNLSNLPDAKWQMIGPKDFFLYAGRDDDGQFFLYSSTQFYELEVTKAEFKKGNGYLGLKNELVVTIHNHGESDFRLPIYALPYYFGDIKPEELSWDKPYTQGDWMYSGAYVKAGQDAEVSFAFTPKDVGTFFLYLCQINGTYLGEYVMENDGIIGNYDEYVANNSYLEAENEDNGEVHLGHVVYHVNFADIPEVTVPAGKPLNSIYAYAAVCDYPGEDYSDKMLMTETYDYLSALPEEAGDGSHQLAFDVDHDIRRGGMYYVWSYLNAWLEDNQFLMSCYQRYDFVVYDNPAIRVEGDSIVGSGEPLDLKILLHSGYPYNPRDYSGAEKAQYTLYDVDERNWMSERQTEQITMTFAQGNPAMAAVDTLTLTGTLPDGKYLVTVSSDVFALGSRDINIVVGATGINKVVSDEPKNQYFDLQGRRLEGRPAKKGIYIRNNRKEVVK